MFPIRKFASIVVQIVRFVKSVHIDNNCEKERIILPELYAKFHFRRLAISEKHRRESIYLYVLVLFLEVYELRSYFTLSQSVRQSVKWPLTFLPTIFQSPMLHYSLPNCLDRPSVQKLEVAAHRYFVTWF